MIFTSVSSIPTPVAISYLFGCGGAPPRVLSWTRWATNRTISRVADQHGHAHSLSSSTPISMPIIVSAGPRLSPRGGRC